MIRLSGNSQSASAAKINLGETIEGIPSRGGPPPSISSRGINGSSIENPLRWADSECSGLMKRGNTPAKKKPVVVSLPTSKSSCFLEFCLHLMLENVSHLTQTVPGWICGMRVNVIHVFFVHITPEQNFLARVVDFCNFPTVI